MLQSRIKDVVFSTEYFVEVVINAVGGEMRGSKTDKAGQQVSARERKRYRETENENLSNVLLIYS